ncbi:ABC-type antimicrobial peptide transport system permease subunit [Bacillus tianshenii]|uniref:ABC-type antimicrobial peptide transport system permease subunit n=1 Tax=Sutcliffiella tianshenii TaxID=1463404 RepID=A0ABS2P3B2_9BACI|nr:hypothetical protein [Bacillus tianshenii]MBM7621122.1 ABC-type antimicrobial peptide transport system permease subunit [Bacillus tianshenii]
MGRKIGVFLFTWFSFLTWLFFAIYFSDESDWWTVIEVEQTSIDTFVVSVSSTRVLIGTIIFFVIGIIVYKFIKLLYLKKRHAFHDQQ